MIILSALNTDCAPSPLCVLSQCCHSDAHLSQTSNGSTDVAKVEYSDSRAGRQPLHTRVSILCSGRAAAERCASGQRFGFGKVR